jgi:hypothetical protein
MSKFKDIVQSYGSFCTIRRTMGADIASACGQLANTTTKKTTRDILKNPVDIEDVLAETVSKSATSEGVAKKPSHESGADQIQDKREEEKAIPKEATNNTSATWLSSVSTDDLENLKHKLTIGSAVAATSLVLVGAFSLRRKQ